MRFTFKKEEKLKSKILIDQLFVEGKRIKSFPILLTYAKVKHTSNYKIQAGFSVPKRRFKRAVDRNRIKRLLRESYRLNKHLIQEKEVLDSQKYVFMFIYISSEIIGYSEIEKAMKTVLQRFVK